LIPNQISIYENAFSRIHVSKSALDNLNGCYEVEPRHGPERQSDRDPYLTDNNIETFLIVRKIKQQPDTSVPGTKSTTQTPTSGGQVRTIGSVAKNDFMICEIMLG